MPSVYIFRCVRCQMGAAKINLGGWFIVFAAENLSTAEEQNIFFDQKHAWHSPHTPGGGRGHAVLQPNEERGTLEENSVKCVRRYKVVTPETKQSMYTIIKRSREIQIAVTALPRSHFFFASGTKKSEWTHPGIRALPLEAFLLEVGVVVLITEWQLVSRSFQLSSPPRR